MKCLDYISIYKDIKIRIIHDKNICDFFPLKTQSVIYLFEFQRLFFKNERIHRIERYLIFNSNIIFILN